MHLVQDDDPDDVLLEDAEPADLRVCLTQIRRQRWDEGHFADQLCKKLRDPRDSALSKGSLSSLLADSRLRASKLQKLAARLELILLEQEALERQKFQLC
jgi:hypothetical protein